jgi:hypothetical protein
MHEQDADLLVCFIGRFQGRALLCGKNVGGLLASRWGLLGEAPQSAEQLASQGGGLRPRVLHHAQFRSLSTVRLG